MKNNRLFLDIHGIQTVPPSNVNRDDTGSPKTAQYGGVRRARVSSQSWKRAMRKYFNDFSDDFRIGVRTKYPDLYVATFIKELEPNFTEEESEKLAFNILKEAGMMTTATDSRRVLRFIGYEQALRVAKIAISEEKKPTKRTTKTEKDKFEKKLQKELCAEVPIDMALFGRMVAEKHGLMIDASSQVAHSISTHGVETEFDYFTAVDDRSPEDHKGAAMIDTLEYNSSTLYRYANIALHEFYHQLNDNIDTLSRAVALYIEAFIKSMPTGKINTFANQTLPQAVLVTLRTDRPQNLVSAFEKPVYSREGYVKPSIEKLLEENEKLEKFVGEAEYKVLVSLEDVFMTDDVEGIARVDSLSELTQAVVDQVQNLLVQE